MRIRTKRHELMISPSAFALFYILFFNIFNTYATQMTGFYLLFCMTLTHDTTHYRFPLLIYLSVTLRIALFPSDVVTTVPDVSLAKIPPLCGATIHGKDRITVSIFPRPLPITLKCSAKSIPIVAFAF